ncbi:MAG: hypothetical protein ABIK47_01730 [candidate division WOR-3 bacterium]
MLKIVFITIFSTVLCAGAEPSDTLPVLYTGLDVISGIPKTGDTFTLQFKGLAFFDLGSVRIFVEVPSGMRALDSTMFERTIQANDTVICDMQLIVESAGPYMVTVHTLLSQSDTVSLWQHWMSHFYILSDEDSAMWAQVPIQGVDCYNTQAEFLETSGSGPTAEYCVVSGQFTYQIPGFFHLDNTIKE